MKEDEEISLKDILINWGGLSKEMRESIIEFDSPKVALFLLKEDKRNQGDLSIDDAVSYAVHLVRIYKAHINVSTALH